MKDGYFSLKQWKDIDCNTRTSYGWYMNIRKALVVGSFYFWLDLIATASLVFEIPWMGVADAIAVRAQHLHFPSLANHFLPTPQGPAREQGGGDTSSTKSARAGRASLRRLAGVRVPPWIPGWRGARER